MVLAFFSSILILIVFETQLHFLRRKGQSNEVADSFQRDEEALTSEFVALLQQKELYKKRQLKLEEVASAMKVNYKTLSTSINKILDKNFNTVVNELRCKNAADLLVNDSYAHFKIEAIGEEVGFNNKVTFFKSFRNTYGVTPSEYRLLNGKN